MGDLSCRNRYLPAGTIGGAAGVDGPADDTSAGDALRQLKEDDDDNDDGKFGGGEKATTTTASGGKRAEREEKNLFVAIEHGNTKHFVIP